MKLPTPKCVDLLRGLGDAPDSLVGPRTELWPDHGAKTIDHRKSAAVIGDLTDEGLEALLNAVETLRRDVQKQHNRHVLETADKLQRLGREIADLKIDIIERQAAADRRMTTLFMSIIAALTALQILAPAVSALASIWIP